MKIDTKLAIAILSILAIFSIGILYFLSQYFPGFPPISWPIKPVKGIEKFKSAQDFKLYLEEGKFAYFMPYFKRLSLHNWRK